MNTKQHKSKLLYPEVSYIIQGAVFEIRKQYGPGQKEVIYQRLLEEKLQLVNIQVEKEKKINIYSQDTGRVMGSYRPDLLVEGKILLELKSSPITLKSDEVQLYHYLRNSEYELGYLINFSSPKLYIKRIIYTNDKKPYLKVSVV